VTVVGLAGLIAATAVSVGNAHAQKSSGIKIGVSLAGYSTDFWSSYVAFEKAAATKYGVSLVGPISSDGDAGKQATQIRTLIDEGVNALIINRSTARPSPRRSPTPRASTCPSSASTSRRRRGRST
jgi:ABC-type sugar transport system substrate-binding protein